MVHLKMLFPSTAQDQEDYFMKCRVSEQLSQIIEYLQLNKTVYTGFKPLSMSSTWVVALVPTSTSASITLISVWLVCSRCIRCAY